MTRHFFSEQAQADYATARINAVRTMAHIADQTGCAFCVVAGDVFESNQVDQRTVARALEALKTFTVPVYLLPGNHDPYNAASLYKTNGFLKHCPEHVHVLTDSTPVEVPEVEAEIVGAPWYSKHPVIDLVEAALSRVDTASGRRRVAVSHGHIREGAPDASALDLISRAYLEDELAKGLVDFVALGHRHSMTSHGTSGRIWHSGTPVATDYDEEHPNCCLVVEIGGKVVVTEHAVGTWKFIRRNFDLNGPADIESVDSWLESIDSKGETVVKLSFVGTLSLSAKARLDDLLEHYGVLFAAVETWERYTELAVHPDDSDLSELGLVGYADAALKRLDTIAQGSGTDAQVAEDALALLYRLTKGAS
jgi:DNA repair exonuclease SbcCD nuclease subunit